MAARILANELQPRLGTPVIVENLVGAGGRLAMQQIQRMPADTNVVVLANPALMVVAPFVYKSNFTVAAASGWQAQDIGYLGR